MALLHPGGRCSWGADQCLPFEARVCLIFLGQPIQFLGLIRSIIIFPIFLNQIHQLIIIFTLKWPYLSLRRCQAFLLSWGANPGLSGGCSLLLDDRGLCQPASQYIGGNTNRLFCFGCCGLCGSVSSSVIRFATRQLCCKLGCMGLSTLATLKPLHSSQSKWCSSAHVNCRQHQERYCRFLSNINIKRAPCAYKKPSLIRGFTMFHRFFRFTMFHIFPLSDTIGMIPMIFGWSYHIISPHVPWWKHIMVYGFYGHPPHTGTPSIMG